MKARRRYETLVAVGKAPFDVTPHPTEQYARRGIVFQLTAHLARVTANALFPIKKDQPFAHSDYCKGGSGINASKGLIAHRKSLGRPRLMGSLPFNPCCFSSCPYAFYPPHASGLRQPAAKPVVLGRNLVPIAGDNGIDRYPCIGLYRGAASRIRGCPDNAGQDHFA